MGQARPIDASGPRYGLFASFDGGLGMLPNALAGSLPPGTARTASPVDGVSRAASGLWRIDAPGLRAPGDFDAVIIALRAPDAARLLRRLNSELGDSLDSIRYGTAATLNLAFRQRDVAHPMNGIGFVVPAAEGLSIIGATFVHRKFAGRAPDEHALIRVFWSEASAGLPDQEVVGRTLRDLRMLIGIQGAPLVTHLKRYPGSMPQYRVGHLDLVDRIERSLRSLPGLLLAGNAYRGVGIPDCVRSGENAAESVVRALNPNID